MDKPIIKYFTLHLSDREIVEINEKEFSDYVLSDLYIGGQSTQTAELNQEGIFFFFQTIGHFTKKDLKNIKTYTKNYGK